MPKKAKYVEFNRFQLYMEVYLKILYSFMYEDKTAEVIGYGLCVLDPTGTIVSTKVYTGNNPVTHFPYNMKRIVG
jgi:hypothetical protein